MARYLNPTESKKRWLDREAPVGYVAGLGRGAVGFTTRSDIGDARMETSFGGGTDDGEEKGDDNDAGLFAGGTYDAEDDEADRMYQAVDEYVDLRRKKRREEREKEELAKAQKERPKIQAQFADAKQALASVSYDEWNAISEPGNLSRAKKQRTERYTAAPNSLLEQARAEQSMTSSIDPSAGLATPLSGVFTPSMTPMRDITKVGEAKQTIMRSKLEALSDSRTGQTSVNPKGYLTDLMSVKVQSAAEIGDKKKARLLLDSVLQSNPKHAPAWISRARLEEVDGKIAQARKYIKEGCEECPNSVDVWLEAARLHQGREAAEILADAVQRLPNAVPLWIAAARLESDPARQKRVYRKALEHIPNSVKLWRAAVQLEAPEDARHMLAHAVECIPSNVEMWLALAKLQPYEEAKKTLNRARATIPTEKTIWITAAQLEEAHGSDTAFVQKVIRKALKSLSVHGVQIDREQWLKEAEQCERAGSVATCQAIVAETIGLGVEDQDRKATWVEDAEQALARGSVETARAIYAHATATFPGKKGLWLRMANMEKRYGTAASQDEVLGKAVKYCVHAATLWLMAAKHKWLCGDVDGARAVLRDAFNANPDNEAIWLAAVKLEKENGQYDHAQRILERARTTAGTARVWMKSALLEREQGHVDAAVRLLQEGLAKFPGYTKLYLMLAQLLVRKGALDEARALYHRGLTTVKPADAVPLWLEYAKLEERLGGPAKARALLEKARLKLPGTPALWLEAIRVEMRAGERRVAFNLLAKALQECPKSGVLWAEAIAMETRPAKKARSVDALHKCDQDAHVMLAVAQLFHQNRQLDKARLWYNRAVSADADLGDAWAAAYQFEVEHGGAEQQEAIVKRCVEADPHHGEKWIAVSKDERNVRFTCEQILKLVASKFAGINNDV